MRKSNNNDDWTISTLKEHFEDIFAQRDMTLKAALDASQEAIEKAEVRLNEILEGFPQEYGRKADIDIIEAEINNIKSDHVRRQEFQDMKDTQSEGRGARLAMTAGLGVVIALIAVALGTMYANQLSSDDVSVQIARETPKPEVVTRIHNLETQVILLRAELKTHEVEDKLRAQLKKK